MPVILELGREHGPRGARPDSYEIGKRSTSFAAPRPELKYAFRVIWDPHGTVFYS
jgi:hypothetical protein